jgi:hypothetical protein
MILLSTEFGVVRWLFKRPARLSCLQWWWRPQLVVPELYGLSLLSVLEHVNSIMLLFSLVCWPIHIYAIMRARGRQKPATKQPSKDHPHAPLKIPSPTLVTVHPWYAFEIQQAHWFAYIHACMHACIENGMHGKRNCVALGIHSQNSVPLSARNLANVCRSQDSRLQTTI